MHPASILRVSGCQCDGMNLNFQKDRFPAISGIAKRMQPYRMVKYLAGLWGEDPAPALL